MADEDTFSGGVIGVAREHLIDMKAQLFRRFLEDVGQRGEHDDGRVLGRLMRCRNAGRVADAAILDGAAIALCEPLRKVRSHAR